MELYNTHGVYSSIIHMSETEAAYDVGPLSAHGNYYAWATMLPIIFNCLLDYCDFGNNFKSKYM